MIKAKRLSLLKIIICKVRPIHGRELVIKCAAQTAREARLYARELTIVKFVSSICAKSL